MTKTVTLSGKSGMGFMGIIVIVFIILRLTGVIAWSWWVIILPLFIIPLLTLGFISVMFIIFLISLLFG